MSTFRYFAYGSNMSLPRLRARTPSARPVGIGMLPQHSLRFHKAGTDQSAKCDAFLTERPTDVVWGVLFDILVAEKPVLDEAEGLGHGYDLKEVTVLCPESGCEMTALTYYAVHVDRSMTPYDWYKAFVLHGAEQYRLPEDYVAAIHATPAILDPDEERRRRNFAILQR